MKVLVIGRGGREHALVWKLAQSPKVKKIYCATGNGGIAELAELVNIPAENVGEMKKFALKQKIDLTIVGPEIALTEGLVDEFQKVGLWVFGPNKRAARLEASKAFAKELMGKYSIPTAINRSFTDQEEAFDYIDKVGAPLVIKADGLAGGKGQIVTKDEITAKLAVNVMLKDQVFGDAGKTVVIEELLSGDEISLIGFTNGYQVAGLQSARDYLRAFDGNRGPITGGIGAYSPVPFVDRDMMATIGRTIINPLLLAMKKEDMGYNGILYIRVILTKEGPKAVEFNVRFADPETQVLMMRLKTDLVDIMQACRDDKLEKLKIEWDNKKAICVVACAGGYPMRYERDLAIEGLEKVMAGDTCVFHATTYKKDNKFYSGGGRAYGITCLGDTFEGIRKRVYDEMAKVNFRTFFYRKDIAEDAEFFEKGKVKI